MKAQEEMAMSEKLHLEDVRGQIECDEQHLVNLNMQLHKTSESLNRQICELKVTTFNFQIQIITFRCFCVVFIHIFSSIRTSLTEEQNLPPEASNIVRITK